MVRSPLQGMAFRLPRGFQAWHRRLPNRRSGATRGPTERFRRRKRSAGSACDRGPREGSAPSRCPRRAPRPGLWQSPGSGRCVRRFPQR
uniref:Uncharacterized protein n=1 Tax=Desulfacinum infernum TaxID=35837 RepID=A0A832A803_9BACT